MEDILLFISRHKWIFAKTYASFAPHEYIVKQRISYNEQVEMIKFARYIKENGYVKKFGNQDYIYLDIGDYMYWTMEDRPEDTQLINRALIHQQK